MEIGMDLDVCKGKYRTTFNMTSLSMTHVPPCLNGRKAEPQSYINCTRTPRCNGFQPWNRMKLKFGYNICSRFELNFTQGL